MVTKKIISKILTAFAIICVLVVPINKALAQVIFSGINGSGSWSSSGNFTGTFAGTTIGYPDGAYSGSINNILGGGTWSGTVKNGAINDGIWSTNGVELAVPGWQGNDVFVPPINTLPGGGETNDKLPEYTLLAPLDGFTTFNANNECPLGKYLGTMINLFMGMVAVLAMVMIVMGGIEYMTGELVSSKAAGKEKIQNAILGLVLALGAWLILNTINPRLLDVCLGNLPVATITISPEDTSNGSSTSLCISTTNPPNPDNANGSNVTLNQTMINEYIPARNSLSNVPLGVKLLITAQTAMEGFTSSPPPGSVAYRTKNPGNIGNVDEHDTPRSCGPPPSKGTRCYNTLADGIAAQANIVTRVANNTATSYKLGSKPTCALGNEAYQGYLYQYLRIYATDARMSNNYLNAIIGYFASQGKTITGKTTIAEIYNMQ